MGAYSQGWAVRCDFCDEQLMGHLWCARTKGDAIEEARQIGWIVVPYKDLTFCCEECQNDFNGSKED